MKILQFILRRLSKMKVEFAIATIIVLVAFFSITTQAANKVTPNLSEFQKGLSENTGQNKQSFDFQSSIGVSASFYTMLAGCTDPACPATLKTGALDYTNQAIAGIYDTPAASGAYYFADVAKNMKLVPAAYAQTPDIGGLGFSVLGPFLDGWRASRNVTYLLFAVFIAALGLMIMFRQRISPQAVMSVQAALPRIISALVLITFSYAIVGLCIDLMYLLFGVLVYALGWNSAQSFANFSNADFGSVIGHVLGRGAGASIDVLGGVTSANIPTTLVGGGILGALTVLAGVFAGPGAVAAALIPLLLGLLITFIGFLIKILFSLSRAYLLLLIYLVFAPFFIIWAAITNQGVYEGWLKHVLSNITVFFVVGVLIYISSYFIEKLLTGDKTTHMWGPPYLGSNALVLRGMIGFGSVVLIAQVPDIVSQLYNIRGLRFDMPGMGRQFDQFSGSLATTGMKNYSSYTAPAKAGTRGASFGSYMADNLNRWRGR
jgi:hypothetical protein